MRLHGPWSVRRGRTLTGVSAPEAAVELEDDEDFGAELSDEELGDLLIREITIDGMCGVY
jgi:mycofactocin precursor